jgi:hypothetical protein
MVLDALKEHISRRTLFAPKYSGTWVVIPKESACFRHLCIFVCLWVFLDVRSLISQKNLFPTCL